MLDANDLLKSIRRAAVEAVRAEKPMEITHGRVISADPLLVEVDQKIQLGKNQLELGEPMQEYEAEVEMEVEELEVELELESGGEAVAARAKGEGTVKGKVKIRRGLEAGTEVILMRAQGGQKYTMYDKVKKE